MVQYLKGDALREAARVWMEDFSAIKNFTPKTVKNKRDLFKRLFRLLQDKEFNSENIEAYLGHLREKGCHPDPAKSKKWQASSLLDEVRFLRAFVVWLARKKYISVDFSKEIEKPKVEEKHKDMVSIRIAEKIIESGCTISPGDNSVNRDRKKETYLALKMLNRCGLRVSELLNIEGKNMMLENEPPIIHLRRKGGKWRSIVCPPDMVSVLKNRVSWPKVFTATEKTMNVSLRRGAQRLGLKERITTHAFRRILVTEMMDRGAHISHVADLMGHSDISITKKIYTQHSVKRLAETQTLFNPLMIERVDPDKLIDYLARSFENSGIKLDKRFHLSISKNSKRLTIRVELITTKMEKGP